MTNQHHRMTCTPAQYDRYTAIVAWMHTDKEFREFADQFTSDETMRTLTADRLAWNSFRAAAEVLGIRAVMEAATKEERKAATDEAKAITADIHAMLWEPGSRVDVVPTAAVSESPRQKSLFG